MAKIAFLLGEDFEDSEFRIPYDRMKDAKHEVTVVGQEKGKDLKGKKGKERAFVDMASKEADPSRFDALVIPGGYSPDHLRLDPNAVSFAKKMMDSGKLVAAVCHGPQLLIEADVVRGKKMTSWPSVRKDLENAGAKWVDQQVVIDGKLITSRKPDDLEGFSRAILERL